MLDKRTSAAIVGAIELFLGRRDGLKRFDVSVEGFWHSFGAILYVLPFFAIIMAADWSMLSHQPDPPTLSRFVVARLFDIVLDFAALPLMLALLAMRLGITRLYAGFIIARNWSAIVIVAPQALISLLLGLGLASMETTELLSLVAIGVMLFYQYRIVRWTLNWNPAQSAGLVAADVALSLILIAFINGLFGA